jgi:DNA-directed RNA polymerase subunit RPC12/RpoP
MNKVVIRCKCGHRIIKRDVLQMRFYLSLFGPSFVSVHYRCGRCKRIGKQVVEEQRWAGFTTDRAGEEPRRKDDAKRKQLEAMGPITTEELIDFHFALDRLTADEPIETCEEDPVETDE